MSLAAIDWQRPWLSLLRAVGEPLAAADDWIAAANRLAADRRLTNPGGLPLRFIAQDRLPAGTPYEAHIAASGQVPTRDNLHDFFNALIWLHFPHTKRTLNTLHAPLLQVPAAPGTRGRQRDAATLFDENAALVVSDDLGLLDALREHRWHQALMHPAERFGAHAEVMLFGHALIEKLVTPYKSITAHVWTVAVEAGWFDRSPTDRLAEVDRQVAATLEQGFGSRDFCHLPVLGVPGWWQEQDQAFYDDADVFRPKPVRQPS
ncbi:MAG: DUF3025 domain-containing protein [Burkholderiaceae bacterium]|nr:DUF3025 domain-containing protein [Burkholderiaceae bacterium]